MIFAPITSTHKPLLNAWIRKQIELLSPQLLPTGIDIRPTNECPQGIYVIEIDGQALHCSPERTYATLQFLQALQEREQQDRADSQAHARIAL